MKDDKVVKIVWYTNAFNCNFSEDGDLGLDGIILEVFNPKTYYLYTAIDIEKTAKTIVLPKGNKISRDELDKIYAKHNNTD